jgi:hypothetical protein
MQYLATPNTRSANPTVWDDLTVPQRRFVITAIILGFSQLILVDIFFRVQELPQIHQFLAQGSSPNFIEDGIQYPPFVISGLACGVLIAASAIFVNSKTTKGSPTKLSWLGSAWLLASLVLVLDLMIDTFEVKWPIIILFAYAGLRYWKGVRRNFLSLVLAPTVAVIAALDGLNHFGGQDCVQTGLDACPGKAISDMYLVIILLLLMYVTIKGLDKSSGS